MSDAGVPLKAPFPYPGGKARVADLVWARLGDVDNYVEPFAGSLAVLLRRPPEHFRDGYRVETVVDLNHYIVNFWRAVKADPETVAEYADGPVLEADLHARHKWLVRSREAGAWRERMRTDPDHFDAKIAGWWVWGQCCWIGGAWCNGVRTEYEQIPGANADGNGYGVNRRGGVGNLKVPDLSSGGCGVAAPGSSGTLQVPELSSERGVASARPQLADAFDIGRGVNGGGNEHAMRPHLTGNTGTGVGVVSNPYAGTCDARLAWLTDWTRRLADRLRLVRTCYGHWSRVCGSDSTMTRLGTTGVFLDPPYPARRADNGKRSRAANLYATDRGADLDALRDEVLAWCRKWGPDPRVRVALCCYEGDGYEPLSSGGWAVHEWEASGGYGNQRRKGTGKSENAKRERIYFSPACVPPEQPRGLYDGYE